MATFPIMRSGKIAMNGTAQARGFSVNIVQFENGSEQRFKTRRQFFECDIVFRNINGYDHGQVMDFFNSAKGRKDDTWSITIEGVTWDYMTFLQDEIEWTDNGHEGFSGSIKCQQVRKN